MPKMCDKTASICELGEEPRRPEDGACPREDAAPLSGFVAMPEGTDRMLAMQDRETALAKPSVLLHSCCGPCSTACLERLTDRYYVTVFFYNPNITDAAEYELRRDAQLKVIERFNADLAYDAKVSFLEGPYEPQAWLAYVTGYEEEPEGGLRCGKCFTMRLEKTALTASLHNFDCFTTTLTVSPHKDSDTILAIGRRLGLQYQIEFLAENFKKKDGYKRSVELSKKYDIYRQDYCGCSFSEWDGCHVGIGKEK